MKFSAKSSNANNFTHSPDEEAEVVPNNIWNFCNRKKAKKSTIAFNHSKRKLQISLSLPLFLLVLFGNSSIVLATAETNKCFADGSELRDVVLEYIRDGCATVSLCDIAQMWHLWELLIL
ncbi:hypothetical protein ACHAXR_009335 [Thalassiosira sp. AJA248-18]